MAVQTRTIIRRDTIGDMWPEERDQWLGPAYNFYNTAQACFREVIFGGPNSYDGTVEIEISADGLARTIIVSFPTQADHDNFYAWAESNHSAMTIKNWLAENYPVGGTATASFEIFEGEVV